MARGKSAPIQAGLTGFADISLVTPPVAPPVSFPAGAVRNRVVISRPIPKPDRKECPYCGAIFDDYTHKATYCRASCRTMMCKYKRRTAIAELAQVTKVPHRAAADVMETVGLPEVERLLGQFGIVWTGKHWERRE